MVGIVGTAAKVPRYYQSASSVVLLASREASVANGDNPFLSFSPSLTLTADAVSRELMSPGTVSELAVRGFTASYTVALPTYTTSTTGSVLLVTATGTNQAGVESTTQAVTAQINTELALMQRGIPASGQVHSRILSIAPRAALSISQTAREPIVVAVLLLVICLGLPIVVDGLVARRQLRRGPAPRSTQGTQGNGHFPVYRPSGTGQHPRREHWGDGPPSGLQERAKASPKAGELTGPCWLPGRETVTLRSAGAPGADSPGAPAGLVPGLLLC